MAKIKEVLGMLLVSSNFSAYLFSTSNLTDENFLNSFYKTRQCDEYLFENNG